MDPSSAKPDAAVISTKTICDGYAAAIRHINDVEIPAIEAKIAMLQALLATLQEEGLEGSALEPVLTAIDQANQNLVDANGELGAFSDEMQTLNCSSLNKTPDGGQQA